MAKLVVTRSGAVSRYPADAQVGKEFPLPLHAVIVGSGESCAVRIDIDSVSPRHARIYFNGDAWIVEDLQSPNCCSVNDMRVATSVLRDSDTLRVGGFTFKFLAAGTFEIPNRNDEGEGGSGAPAELRIRLPKPSN